MSGGVIKNEITEDMDVDNENHRADITNNERNIEENSLKIKQEYPLTIKQEKGYDDTLQALNNEKNLEMAINLLCPLVPIKKENEDEHCDVTSSSLLSDNNKTSYASTSKENKLYPMKVDSIELSKDVDKEPPTNAQGDAVFSSDSQLQFNFNFSRNEGILIETIFDEEEELSDTLPSTPLLENEDTVYELTNEHVAFSHFSISEVEQIPAAEEILEYSNNLTNNDSFLYALNSLKYLNFKSKINFIDLLNCASVLTAIRKLVDIRNINPSINDEKYEDTIKKSLLVYCNADMNVSKSPIKTTTFVPEAEENSSVPSSSKLYSPVFSSLPRRELAVYETPDTVSLDQEAMRCLEGWGKDEIKKLIIPAVHINGISPSINPNLKNVTQVESQPLGLNISRSEKLKSSSSNSGGTTGNPLQRKRSFPESDDCLKSSPPKTVVPVSATLDRRRSLTPNKMPRCDVTSSASALEVTENVEW